MIVELLATGALVAQPAADAAKEAYTFRPLVRGLDAPVYVTAPSGAKGTLYVVEQRGRIRIVRNGRLAGTFLDISDRVRSGGEQGLLSLAFAPDYAKSHRFYVNYTNRSGDTRVVEFRTRDGKAIRSSARTLLSVSQPYENHNGGQLQFDRKGYLYVGMGDGGSAGDPGDRAQDLSARLGKLLRTNPRRPIRWAIVGYGLRNPWRFSFDRANGNLWIGDVGQNAIEEIDFRGRARIGKLANYGWNRFEGNTVFDDSNPLQASGELVFPVVTYGHSGGSCSVTGGYVYRGRAVASARGRYFYGDFCSGGIWSFQTGEAGRMSAVRSEPFSVPSLSSFGEDASGELYATSLNGTLYRFAA